MYKYIIYVLITHCVTALCGQRPSERRNKASADQVIHPMIGPAYPGH